MSAANYVYPYPSDSQASAAFSMVVAKTLAGTLDDEFANASYALEGYGLSKGLPKFLPSAHADPHAELKNLAAAHQAHVGASGVFGSGQLLGILKTWLPILLQILSAAGTVAGGAPVAGS